MESFLAKNSYKIFLGTITASLLLSGFFVVGLDSMVQASATGATITVNKVCMPGNDPGKFNLQIDGTIIATDVPCGGSSGSIAVSTGHHVISEVAGTGTNLSNYTQGFSGDCASNPNVISTPGSNKVCTITNVSNKGLLIVKKHVVNDNGGALAAGNFTLHVKSLGVDITGSPASGTEAGVTYSANPGLYTVSENPPPSGYAQTGFSGDCNSNGDVTLVAGLTRICTITNDDIGLPQLIVQKTVINHGQSKQISDFTLTVDGSTVDAHNIPILSGSLRDFNPGAHIVSELPDSNYTTTFGGDCTANGSITLVSGQSPKLCTITNEEKRARIKIHAEVINHGSNFSVSHFAPYEVDSTAMALDAFTGFDSGTYVISESPDPHYTETFSGDCTSGGALILSSGQDAVCTITNEEGGSNTPTIDNFDTSYNGCTGIAGAGQVLFSWTPHYAAGTAQHNFAFQIAPASDTNFSNPPFVVDRAVNGVGTQQSVLVRQNPGSGAIGYGESYHWRVKSCSADACSDWTDGGIFQQSGHPSPFSSFTFSPANPATGTPVSFINNSICYNNSGLTACQSYLWNFGDGQTATQSAPPAHSYQGTGRFLASLRVTDDTDYCDVSHAIVVGPVSQGGPAWKETSPANQAGGFQSGQGGGGNPPLSPIFAPSGTP